MRAKNVCLEFAHGHSLLKHYVSEAGPSIEVECWLNLYGVVGRRFVNKREGEINWQDAGEKFSH